MSILSSSLLPKDIHLHLKGSNHGDVLEELIFPLRSDPRVGNWEKLRASLVASSTKEIFRECPSAMFLHHGRTESVTSLVLAAGRSDFGFISPFQDERIRLVFVAAIPDALNNEYLRILGAISRVCREEEGLSKLLNASDQGAFISVLEKGCRQ